MNRMMANSGAGPGTECVPKTRIAFIVLIALIVLGALVPLTQARAPDWNYSSPDAVIGGMSRSMTGMIGTGSSKTAFPRSSS